MAADANAPKDELVQTAEDLGVQDAEKLKKADLADAINARVPEALGPVVPAGEVTAAAPTGDGKTITGVQTLEVEDIPEEAR